MSMFLVVACAMGFPSRAQAAEPYRPGAATADDIAALIRRAVEAKDIRIEHQAYRLEPVSFGSKPCRRRVQVGSYSRSLGDDWVHRFSTTMGVQRLGADSIRRTCRGDSTRIDVITVTFGKGKQAVVATLDPAGGTAAYAWNDSLLASMPIAHEAASVLKLIAEALPKDEHLTTIRPCTDTMAAPAWAGAPRDRDIVYTDQLPEPIHRAPPEYPDEARRKNVDGTVMVQALISTRGTVTETIIVRSVPMLDEAAVRAVERWRFEPARAEGKAVAVWVAVPIKFRLE